MALKPKEINQLNDYIKTIEEVRTLWNDNFSKGYADILGLCKVAKVSEIEEQGWSLNPGRYVGVEEAEEDDDDSSKKPEDLPPPPPPMF